MVTSQSTDTVAVWAVALGASPASRGRHSSAAARPPRSRRTAERVPAAVRAEERAELSEEEAGRRGANCRPAEEEDSGGEASGRERSHREDANWATRRPGDPATRRPGDPATRRPGDPATRRPGDPATRRPGDPATRRPGDYYTVGTLSGACQPSGRTNFVHPAVQAQRPRDRCAQCVPCLVRHGHRVASEPVARLTVPRLVRRRTHSRQASPVPLAQTVNRTRRQRKKARQPSLAHR